MTRPRRGQSFMPDAPLYGLEQEHSLELPLGYATSTEPLRVAVLLHAYHIDLLTEFRTYLDYIPVAADLFISTDTEEKRAVVAACFADWTKGVVELQVMPNRGRDVAPKIVGFGAVHDRYDYVLHLHTKSSPHDSRLVGWRGYLLDTLLGSPAVVQGVFEIFARAPRVGMLAPQHIDDLRPWIRWGQNYAQAAALAGRMGFPLLQGAPLDFPSGSMFWARGAALRPLLDLHLAFEDFQAEAGQTDGTLAHAIERLYFLVCERAGFDWLKITGRGLLHEQMGVAAVSTPQELDRFLARRGLRLSSRRDEAKMVGDDPVITSAPPRPRRVLHVTWRAALGEGVAVPRGRRLVIAVFGAAAASARLLRSAEVALRQLPAGVHGQLLVMSGSSRVLAEQAGFAACADLVLLIGADGVLHPHSGTALLQMSEAHEGRALLELASVPGCSLNPGSGEAFGSSLAAGPAIAVSRLLHEAVGSREDECVLQRARAMGFDVLSCPRALFYAGSSGGVAA